MSKKRKLGNACAYCGNQLNNENYTEDHIPPKSFFTSSENTLFKPLKVPACKSCNNGASKQDENAKHVINMCVAQMGNQTSEQVEKHRRTLIKNKRLRKPLETSEWGLLQDTETGVYTFEKKIVLRKQEIEDTKLTLLRLAKGIYWKNYGQPILSREYQVSFVAGLDLFASARESVKTKQEKLRMLLELIENSEKCEVIENVYTYWILRVEEPSIYFSFIVMFRKSLLVAVFIDE